MRDNICRLESSQLRLDEVTDMVLENLQNCTPELKRLAFDALHIKVYASTETVEIQGVIPLDLPTIARKNASFA